MILLLNFVGINGKLTTNHNVNWCGGILGSGSDCTVERCLELGEDDFEEYFYGIIGKDRMENSNVKVIECKYLEGSCINKSFDGKYDEYIDYINEDYLERLKEEWKE